MTNEELNIIEARANTATEGPWEFRPVKDRDGTPILDAYPEIFLPNNTVVARTYAWGSKAIPRRAEDKWAEAAANAKFVASARTDVPTLVAEVRRLQKGLDAALRCLMFRLTKASGPQEVIWLMEMIYEIKAAHRRDT